MLSVEGYQPPAVRPTWTLTELIHDIRAARYAEGRSSLEWFELDMTRAHVPGTWRPSRSMRCRRYNIYKAAGIRGLLPPWDPTREIIFDRGHIFGAWAAAYLRAAPESFGITDITLEVVMHNERIDLGGKADITFKRWGVEYAVEVKSKTNPKLLEKLVAPEKPHLNQLNDYLEASGLTSGFILYILLEHQGAGYEATFRDFWHERSEILREETRTSLQSLEIYRQRPDLAPPADGNKWFECNGCPYSAFCEMDLPTEVAKARFG